MRGIVCTLICSMFLNSTLGVVPNDTLLLAGNQLSAYEMSAEDTASEDIISGVSLKAVSANQIMTLESEWQEENIVSVNDSNIGNFEEVSDFTMDDYEIIGTTKDGKSIAVKKSMVNHEDMPSKPFEKPDFDWNTL